MTEPNHTQDKPCTEMEAPVPRKPGRPSSYTEEQRRRALLVLAKHGGNSIRAEAELTQQGNRVPASTLTDWRLNQHPELYTELHAIYTQEIEARLVPEYRDTALLAAQVAYQAVEASRDDLAAGKVKDPSTMARNLMVTSGTSLDKVLILTERPTQRTENTDVASVLRSLEHLIPGMQPAVDTTANDITDAEVVHNQRKAPQLENPSKAAPQSVSGREH